MEKRVLTEKMIKSFQAHLISEEKSHLTVVKYISDVVQFYMFTKGADIEKSTVLEFKEMLTNRYAAKSVNSKLASIGSLFGFLGWQDLKVKNLKLQKQIYLPESKELTKGEYARLCEAAKGNRRLCLIIKAICSTGIRVSELKFFTLESVKLGTVTVRSKAKTRDIILPDKLRRLLLKYCKSRNITSGLIFRTRSGRPIDRSNIWSDMKRLCKKAGVNPSKVFPHNLRKLFARTFYGIERDIAKLADILGHSSIDTTRIYIMSTGAEHRRKIDRLGLVV